MTQQNHIHWKRMVNPDYLGAYALDDGQDMILTIQSVGQEVVVSTGGKKETCVVAHFREDVKPMILNRTNLKMITKIYGTPYIDEWAGKKIQVYQDKTKFGGEVVECLRIRHTVPAAEPEILCADCKKPIMPSGRMSAAQLAEYARGKFGRALCADCGRKANEAAK